MNWRRTLVILWLCNFLIASGMSLIIPFLPLYIEKLGVNHSGDIYRWSGWVFSAQFVTSVFFQPIWGKIADRYGRKIMLLRAGLGMGIVTSLMGMVTTVWQLFFLRMINGIFSGFISMAVSLQASITPDKETGVALGTLQTGAIAGNLIGPLMGGLLAEFFGYRVIFFITGTLLILASIVVLIYVDEKHERREKTFEERGSINQLIPLIPVFLASIVTQMGMMSIEPIVTIYAKSLYLGTHIALVSGLVVSMTGVANLFGAPTLGKLGDRIGQRKVLILSLLAAAIMYIPQALAGNIYVLIIGRFLLGLFIGGMIPSLNTLVKIKAPKNLQATAFGFNSSSTFLGNLIGPLIGSSVAAAYGIRNVFYVTMSILIINAIIIYFNKKLDTHPPIIDDLIIE